MSRPPGACNFRANYRSRATKLVFGGLGRNDRGQEGTNIPTIEARRQSAPSQCCFDIHIPQNCCGPIHIVASLPSIAHREAPESSPILRFSFVPCSLGRFENQMARQLTFHPSSFQASTGLGDGNNQ
uniref:Uncharacterized protein n=1 Tax=Bionectria ochroleuca TaxID=29856 RepID=A0A8H7TJS8_BIOOC